MIFIFLFIGYEIFNNLLRKPNIVITHLSTYLNDYIINIKIMIAIR